MTTTTTEIDCLVLDLDTTNNTNTKTKKLNKSIEAQVQKVLNIDQNTFTATSIFPNTNLDDIMADAVSIWNVLGLTEEEYNKKFFDKNK